jgi:hypothetical protein
MLSIEVLGFRDMYFELFLSIRKGKTTITYPFSSLDLKTQSSHCHLVEAESRHFYVMFYLYLYLYLFNAPSTHFRSY